MSTPTSPADPPAQESSRAPQHFGDASAIKKAHRAELPRASQLPPSLQRAEAEQAVVLREREGIERRSMLRGLILLALVVLILSMFHAGAERVFPAGWWRQW
ncbi:MAG: hypothetical protein ACRYFU_08605 [Janthinobacterium lividum]